MTAAHVIPDTHTVDKSRRKRSEIVDRVLLTVAALLVTGTVGSLMAFAFIAFSKSNAPTGGGG